MPCLQSWRRSRAGKRRAPGGGVLCERLPACLQCVTWPVHLPLERELCPFDLAPVTSTAAQMLFGDTVRHSAHASESLHCPGCHAGACCGWRIIC